jgi:3-oxoacyl-(acyl-carrier-protein) synthase
MNRVAVITGVGCITPLGNSPEDFRREIASMIRENTPAGADRIHLMERRVKDFIFSDRELLQKYPRLDIGCQYILQAARQAIDDANLTPERIKNYRVGVIVGSTFGMLDSQEKFLRMLYRTGKGSPMYFQQTANNLPSGIIAYKYRIDGINVTLYNGWTAGLDAIILAGQLISSDQADIVIAGGVDILNESIHSQYRFYMNKKSFHHSFLPGEGAGVLILEPEELAWDRKQKSRGKIMAGEQRTFLRNRDFKQALNETISGMDFSFYFSNMNRTPLDDFENEVIESQKLNEIALKNHMGECGAASGVLQAIYALHLDGASLVVNAGMGRVSFLQISSDFKERP